MAGTQHFGGIYKISQLKNVKIMSLPVSLIVWKDNHWMSMFITKNDMEVMDSAGLVTKVNVKNYLLKFLRLHLRDKNLSITPQLQSDRSNACAIYAMTFIIYRTSTGRSLCDFCNIFTNNPRKNCEIIKEIFATLWPDSTKLII